MTKSELLLIRRLREKKYRENGGLFIAEGSKLIKTLQTRLKVRDIYTCNPVQPDAIQISVNDMERISAFKTASDMLAVFEIPQYSIKDILKNGWTLILDGVQDPGNLGSIIRLADWFGVADILCSPDTADCWQPKAVQASMGAVAGVRILYGDIYSWITHSDVPVYGLTLNSKNIYEQHFEKTGVFVLGSEGHGLSMQVQKVLHHRLSIPSINDNLVSESLNVTAAAAIALGLSVYNIQ